MFLGLLFVVVGSKFCVNNNLGLVLLFFVYNISSKVRESSHLSTRVCIKPGRKYVIYIDDLSGCTVCTMD